MLNGEPSAAERRGHVRVLGCRPRLSLPRHTDLGSSLQPFLSLRDKGVKAGSHSVKPSPAAWPLTKWLHDGKHPHIRSKSSGQEEMVSWASRSLSSLIRGTCCMICTQVCSLTKTRTCNPARARVRIVDRERTGADRTRRPPRRRRAGLPVLLPSRCHPAGSGQRPGLHRLWSRAPTAASACGSARSEGLLGTPSNGRSTSADHCDGRPACVASCPTGALSYFEASEDTRGARQRSPRRYALPPSVGRIRAVAASASGVAG